MQKKVSRLDKILNLLHSLTDFRGFIAWGRSETMPPQYGGGKVAPPKDNLLNRPYLLVLDYFKYLTHACGLYFFTPFFTAANIVEWLIMQSR